MNQKTVKMKKTNGMKVCFDVIGEIFKFLRSPAVVMKLFNLSKWVRKSMIQAGIKSDALFTFLKFPETPQLYVKKIRLKGKGRRDRSSQNVKWSLEDCEKLMKQFPNLKEFRCRKYSTPFKKRHLELFEQLDFFCFPDAPLHEEKIDDLGYYEGLRRANSQAVYESQMNVDYILMNCGYVDRLVDGNKQPIYDRSSYQIRRLKKRDDESEEELQEELPLKGVKISVSQIGNPERTEIREIAMKLGAVYSPKFTPEVTHLIVPSENAFRAKKVKEALKNDNETKIVDKQWVYDCNTRKKRVTESSYLQFGQRSSKFSSDDSDVEIIDKYKLVFIEGGWERISYEYGDPDENVRENIEKMKKSGIHFHGCLYRHGIKGRKLGVKEVSSIMGMMHRIPSGHHHCACFSIYELYNTSLFKVDGKTFYVAHFDTESG